ncbi:2-oxo acid dehydrogenase subunit E2 [Paramicrobacterium agarici]|uniref:Dihydrolipoamide acetyltransferase component of pyruvate dehydrogenase complex n=1 Tax=Paramicrobacterium agarici TaxID=630514 RepID=A0A2A9DYP6_9MICO|nr:2-oxo acid dehydrogenase subunit E2 [Microbacterium agarici]PFG31255.1 2-oxoglutarate dehydrogenase E2 component [Microbacterium agarici]
MSETVNLPALGESVTEGTVTRWLKSVGDHVDVDEPLLEVSTDKVDTEIPSPVAGVLEEILAQEDDTIDVGAPLAKVGDGSGTSGSDAPAEPEAQESEPESQAPEPEPEAEEESPAQPPASSSGESSDESDDQGGDTDSEQAESEPASAESSTQRGAETSSSSQSEADTASSQQESADVSGNAGYVTPLVRRLANQHSVDLSTVEGTGVGGRIRKEDVLEAASRNDTSSAKTPAPATVSELRGTTQPMTRLRKVAAEQAVSSRQATAQVTTVIEADITTVTQLVDRVQDAFTKKTGKALEILPFIAKAAIQALQEQPVINATVDGDQIVYPSDENLSVAVDTDRGLLSPVVKNASSLDVAGLAAAIDDLAERTRSNSLKPDELSGGTFTIASSDARGTLIETPLVFLPQSAALSVGAVSKRAVVVDSAGTDAIAIRSVVYLSLSYDQRIIDSTDASRFLASMTNALETEDFEGQLGL